MLVHLLAKGLPKPVENLEPPAIFHWSALSNHMVWNIFGISPRADSSVQNTVLVRDYHASRHLAVPPGDE